MRGLTGSIRNPKNNGQAIPFPAPTPDQPWPWYWTWGQGYLHLTELQLEPDVAGGRAIWDKLGCSYSEHILADVFDLVTMVGA